MTMVYMFPGQGSQVKGMGKEVFAKYPELAQQASDILGFSIQELCVLDPNNQLGKTQYTQPALFVVDVLSYLDLTQNGTQAKPDLVLGHSLGEYAALFAANVLSFESGLNLIKKRGELMSQMLNGKMAAVVGLDFDHVSTLLATHNLTEIDVANINSNNQIVISGPATAIEQAKSVFDKRPGVMYIILNVSGAFHSRYMKDVAAEYLKTLDNYQFMSPTIPVISNATATLFQQDNIKQNLYEQIFSPVKWQQSIQYCQNQPHVSFKEIGPGQVLTNMLRNIK